MSVVSLPRHHKMPADWMLPFLLEAVQRSKSSLPVLQGNWSQLSLSHSKALFLYTKTSVGWVHLCNSGVLSIYDVPMDS